MSNSKYEQYRKAKLEIEKRTLTPIEYQRAIQDLAKKLGI